jgi:hypothetical protein
VRVPQESTTRNLPSIPAASVRNAPFSQSLSGISAR